MTTKSVTLHDGRSVTYVEVPDPPQGGMKKVYFAPDRSQVVAFFHDAAASTDPNRMARLQAVVGRYNPITADPETAAYWSQLFCWPSAIVAKPVLGVLAPTYPKNFFFATGPFIGKEKKAKWFTSPKLRKYLPEAERGTWINYLQIGIRLARAVRRLHSAGLAHSDLSCNNVLIDPTTGQCVVIDIDSLVVPGMFPPDVLGTPGYIAPEVIASMHLPLHDPNRKHASIRTDLHALPVLLYEYLFSRHPLVGPKIHATASAEADETLAMGAKALFIEHPKDKSNRPPDLAATTTDLGPVLQSLFERSFVNGLHSPNDRPAAIEWEKGLVKTWDMLHPCANAACAHKWFPVYAPTVKSCPFCKTKLKAPVPMLKLRKQRQPGNWHDDGSLVLHGSSALYAWHVYDNVFPGEKADRTRLGYFGMQNGHWMFVNEKLPTMQSPGGNRVPPGQGVALQPGKPFLLAQGEHGRMAEIEFSPA